MTLRPQNQLDTCSACGASLQAAMRHCPTCRADAGDPNVRVCRTDLNTKALAARFNDAQKKASANGCSKVFSTLLDLVKKNSGVVISMPASVARTLLDDPNSLYSNYERLVGSKVRKPAAFGNDQTRCAVAGLLFGSYAESIIYGALSLTMEGLPTYGSVHCLLRSVAIEKRTTFLETNGYKFFQDRRIVKLPDGYRACWEDRHTLVLAKLADCLSTGQTESDWQALIICSDGMNRENDDFVEAHIYEGFDANAIKSITLFSKKKLTKDEKLDQRLAMATFEKLRGKAK
jgi:hypothetical protein